MKKIILIIFTLALLSFTACSQLIDAIMENEKADDSAATNLPTDSAKPTEAKSNDIPSLPDLDYSQMDLFEDGFQIVYFDHASDGDTAIFVVGDSFLKTRFLGVDTKEMSTDSGVPEPWAQQAKEFTEYMLSNADEIILELDEKSDTFDSYDRLLAWIWVDGQLLNYMLAESGYADVKYLYDDYKYNDYLLDAEYSAQNANLGIWGGDEPYFNPNDFILEDDEHEEYISIQQARNMSEENIVQLSGIVTSKIGNNAFVQDETGGIYVYVGSRSYSALSVGNEISIKGMLTDYNGLLEISEIKESDVRILSSDNAVTPKLISLSQIDESLESQFVQLQNLLITFVDYQLGESGYTIFVEQNGIVGEVRIDKYLQSFPDPESLQEGDYIDVMGNVAQHYDSYQIMISSEDDIKIN